MLSEREGFVELSATQGSRAQASRWRDCIAVIRTCSSQPKKSANDKDIDYFIGKHTPALQAGNCDTVNADVLRSCVRYALGMDGDSSACSGAIANDEPDEEEAKGQKKPKQLHGKKQLEAEKEQRKQQKAAAAAHATPPEPQGFNYLDPDTWEVQTLQVCVGILDYFDMRVDGQKLRQLQKCELRGNTRTRGHASLVVNTAMHVHAQGGNAGIGFAYVWTTGTREVTPYFLGYAPSRDGNEYKWKHSAQGYNPDLPPNCPKFVPLTGL